MQKLQDERRMLSDLFDTLERHMGKDVELVLHDFNNSDNDLDHTITDIRNGHVTGRELGGSGTAEGLLAARGVMYSPDCYDEQAIAYNGHPLSCASLYIYNGENRAIGSICLNRDVSRAVAAEQFMHEYNVSDTAQSGLTVSNIGTAMGEFIEDGIRYIGKQPDKMNREDKRRFVKYLDQKGVFLITKSGTKICSLLGISKYTLYKYLGHSTGGNRA